MGVNGLLPLLKEIQDPSSLERYRNKTLAIDAFGWLHRGIVSCAEDLCLNKPTRSYITSILKKVQMLKHFNITPYFVFDGQSLPMKQETNNERLERREEARKLAEKLYNDNKKPLAYKQFMKAAYVNSKMVKSVMCELDLLGIKYVVAPYEADPQMVYLEKIGLVDGILSEDSDLLIFGCKKLITKLKDNGTCVEIDSENFDKVRQIPYLGQYSREQMRLVAMISGCDYTKGIPGIGLKTAFQLVRKYNNLEKILIALRATGKFSGSPDDLKIEIAHANLAFQYQKVFNPKDQQLTSLNEVNDEVNEELLELCCGKKLTNDLYVQICNGKIHPHTHDILISREQNLSLLKSNSVKYESKKGQSAIRSQSELSVKTRSIVDLLKSTKRVQIESSQSIKRQKSEVESIRKTNIDKRIDKLTQSKNGTASKFFKPQSEENPTDDDENIQEDEDQEYAIQENEVYTDNIPDEIDDSMLPTEEEIDKMVQHEENFNLNSQDDEIDESPIKKDHLQKCMISLRDTFSYSLKPLQEKNMNTPQRKEKFSQDDDDVSEEDVINSPIKKPIKKFSRVDIKQFAYKK
ncbi:unnamed protein product [Candida verbasci]|uniref:Exonuclease 1 n=1 Tax=Candida verbasci TaxID=1227364 RepID=A0A9W4XC22_9ASCO|nr:unnamed protein product [Candida verbasci]